MVKEASKSDIKAIIFDAGGVLFKHDWEKVKAEIMKKYGFSIFLYSDYPEEIRKKYDRKISVGEISLKKVFRELSGLNEVDEVIEDYKKTYLKHEVVDKKMLGLIKDLKKKYKIFCLTNTSDLHFEANTKAGLFSVFDKVYASSNIGFKKPEKEAFEVILKDNNLRAEEYIFIDDVEKNVKAASEIGMKGLVFENYDKLVIDIKELI
mgnify:CR=1 FL=1